MTSEVEKLLQIADRAQSDWATEMPRKRIAAVARIAGLLAERCDDFTDAIHRPAASEAEIIASEVLPLADACRFVGKVGRRTLAPQNVSSRHGAWWMGRIGIQVIREPWGVVLILAPSNYPLLLPGTQIIQALAAGNAVAVKPAPGGEAVLQLLKECLVESGVPDRVIQILPSDIEAGQAAVRQGVDKVILTGSVHTGRAVLRELAETLTPSTMELSGCDACFVLPQADIKRTAKAIAYALTLNGGATCIAPRRVYVTAESAEQLKQELLDLLAAKEQREFAVGPQALSTARRAIEQALSNEAKLLFGELPAESASEMQPVVITNVQKGLDIAKTDIFAPVVSIFEVEDMVQANSMDQDCPYSLGASIFGPQTHAEHWANQLRAGCVVINDLVVPTADPRVAFGGRDQSGWGVTRGREGLLEMTQIKTICTRYGNWLPHLDENSQDPVLLKHLLGIFHNSSFRSRFRSMQRLMKYMRG